MLFFYGSGGALMCFAPVPGLTSDLLDQSPHSEDTIAFYGSRWFVAESMSRSTAQMLVQALGGILLYDFRVPSSHQLIGDSRFCVEHGGNRYDVGHDSDGLEDDPRLYAGCEYQRDGLIQISGSSMKAVVYYMSLVGYHAGPPIVVLMVNPHDEPDGYGGRDLVWDSLLWADTQDPFDIDWLLDTYTDALHSELREIARNWTS